MIECSAVLAASWLAVSSFSASASNVSLAMALACNSASFFADAALRAANKVILGRFEAAPQGIVDFPGCFSNSLPFGEQLSEFRTCGGPFGGVGQLFGPLAEPFLGLLDASTLPVELGEM